MVAACHVREANRTKFGPGATQATGWSSHVSRGSGPL
jgi:hypothetical protein